MTRKTLAVVTTSVMVLGSVGAWECGDGATPKSQCQDGSRRAQHKSGKTTLSECHNGEWIKVQCFNGSSKAEKGVYYYCKSNRWVKR